MKLKIFFICCFTLLLNSVEGKTIFQYGLSFNSYEVEKDERTSLNLTPESPFSFPDGFIMEFEVSFKQVLHNFGYIFRIIGADNENIDLLLSRTRNSHVLEPQLNTIFNAGQLLNNQLFKDLEMDFGQWVTVKVAIDSRNGLFRLIINDKEFETTGSYFKKFKKVNIVFGKNDIISFETSDVPTMSLRNIRIKNINEKEKYFWKLARHTGNGVYDEHENHFAAGKAPNWLLDSHSYWKTDTVFTTGIYPQITFNQEKNEIAIADRQAFYTYDVTRQALARHLNTSGFPLGNKSNNLKYDAPRQQYFTYNFVDKVAWYDFSTKSWSNEAQQDANSHPHYWHHNSFLDLEGDALYLFGGYGFHIYKNIVHKYSFATDTWQQMGYAGDTIAPRYLSGLGALDNKNFLLFGGYGSEKGNQELSPRNYYDLYTYNVETSQTQKIWELNATQHNFVVANSLVVDTVNNYFYALCFPHQKFNSSLQLYRFSTSEPRYEILADSIPYVFSDIFSYADLYLSKDGEQLIAVTSYTDERKMNATVAIHSLAFPPLTKMDLVQPKIVARSPWGYVLLILFLFMVPPLYLLRRSRKNKPETEDTDDTDIQMSAVGEEEMLADPIVGIRPLQEKYRKQSILLFGGFQVIDKDSNKITGEFTPTLKQLFLLILLYTLKDGKGISSVKLRDTLWYDKTNESAKNNRGVSLSKLRVIFEKIGPMSIGCVNSYWTVEFGDDIYCDYYEAIILMNRLSHEIDHKDINRLVSIVSAGELLPNVETEWVDSFKSDFSNRLIDFLLDLIDHSSEYQLTSPMMINIADAIFAHDSLNEDALKIKCSVLVGMGKNGLAQKAYASFVKEYQALFGVEFKHSFEQVVS